MIDYLSRLPTAPEKAKRLCGVFVLPDVPFLVDEVYARQCYFPSTLAVSQAFGFRGDKIGQMMRKWKRTPAEGYACWSNWVFVSANAAFESGLPSLHDALLLHFPWLRDRNWRVHREENDVRWVCEEEHGTVASKPRTKPAKLRARATSETILNYVI
jgi:hypothetical protein